MIGSTQEVRLFRVKISSFMSRKQNSNGENGANLTFPCKECGMKFTEQERLKLLILGEEKGKSLHHLIS